MWDRDERDKTWGKRRKKTKEGGEKRDMFYRILFQELTSIRN